MRPQILKADGTMVAVDPANGVNFESDQLSKIVGGHIECLWPGDGTIIVLNEEGKFDNLPPNMNATMAAKDGICDCDTIMGDVLHCPEKMVL